MNRGNELKVVCTGNQTFNRQYVDRTVLGPWVCILPARIESININLVLNKSSVVAA